MGTSSANTIVNSGEDDRDDEQRDAVGRARGHARRHEQRARGPSARLTAANAEARKPMNVSAELDDGEEPARVVDQPSDAPAPGRPSSTSCSTRLRRTETSAISAATKKPSRSVRTTRNRISPSDRAGSPRPALRPGGRGGCGLADPGRDADRELARRDVLRDHGAGAGPRAVAERDGRAEHRVDAQEHALADRRAVLGDAVVVGGDRARRRRSCRRRRPRRRGSSCGAGARARRGGVFLSSAKLPISAPRADVRRPAGGG